MHPTLHTQVDRAIILPFLCCDPCCVQFVLHFVCACASCVAVPSFLAWHVAAWWAAKWNTVGTQWFWAWCVPPEHTTQVWKIKH